jgi:hypothetical protein
MKTILLFMTMLFGLLATPATTKSQTEKARYGRLSNSPPRVAFLVYGELKPESVGTYERAESGVVHGYDPYKIPVYRVGVGVGVAVDDRAPGDAVLRHLRIFRGRRK